MQIAFQFNRTSDNSSGARLSLLSFKGFANIFCQLQPLFMKAFFIDNALTNKHILIYINSKHWHCPKTLTLFTTAMADQEPQSQRTNEIAVLQESPKRGDFTVNDLRTVIAEQAGMQTSTGDAARATLERAPDQRISFGEAVQLLKGKLDLEAARIDAVKSHGRWRLVGALIKAGVINDATEYGALFDNVTINAADIMKVRASLERGEKVLPIFDAGAMTPYELFAVLFTEGGVPNYTNSYGFQNLAKLRRIDPKDIPDLANLAEKLYQEQYAAFEAAYKEADDMRPTGARVTFTPNEREVTRTGTSTAEDMQAFAKGEISFLDPNADFLRFRAQMDAGLREIAGIQVNFDGMSDEAYSAFLKKAFDEITIDKYMPDRKRITRHPSYVFENGGVSGIRFRTDSHLVGVCVCDPDVTGDYLGSRISLGQFRLLACPVSNGFANIFCELQPLFMKAFLW